MPPSAPARSRAASPRPGPRHIAEGGSCLADANPTVRADSCGRGDHKPCRALPEWRDGVFRHRHLLCRVHGPPTLAGACRLDPAACLTWRRSCAGAAPCTRSAGRRQAVGAAADRTHRVGVRRGLAPSRGRPGGRWAPTLTSCSKRSPTSPPSPWIGGWRTTALGHHRGRRRAIADAVRDQLGPRPRRGDLETSPPRSCYPASRRPRI